MRFVIRPQKIALTFVACLLCTSASAQIVYKWVDEKGVTHYGGNLPADRKAQKVNVPAPGTPVNGSATAPRPSLQQQEIEFNRRRIAREEEESKEKREMAAPKCAALAREIADQASSRGGAGSTDPQFRKINEMCPDTSFECTTSRENPKENKCESVPSKDGKIMVRNTVKNK
jgi:type IV secretory pathway VirB10-like protein